ncbi:MAG: 50S ribosomal protein L24 [Deltaproteobacteria bacterium]|nr:MAG: 50S ribosomal protein L24 [Deltaproteobacteria bacterium]
MNRIKKGDLVRVIAGKEKGKEGKVLGFSHNGERALVEKLNMVKRHTRPTQTNQAGGIIEKEAGIHLSNLMPLTPSGKPTRVQFRINEDGQKVRYSSKYEEYLD